MRIYPDLPLPWIRAVALDALVLTFVLLCLMAGRAVHDAVAELDVLGRGVERAGTQVEDTLRDAGERVGSAPVVGGRIEDALTDAGARSGEPVQRAGRRGRVAVADLADVLGLLVGGLPVLLVGVTWLPRRVGRARAVLAARRFLDTDADGAIDDDVRLRLLASRAAFALPFADLLRYTRDPMGDLAAGRYGPLLAALGDAYGLRPPGDAGMRQQPHSA